MLQEIRSLGIEIAMDDLGTGYAALDYLLIYLLNNWIPRDWAFIGVFTLCFAVGYALIWGIILLSIRHRTNRINRHLRGGK